MIDKQICVVFLSTIIITASADSAAIHHIFPNRGSTAGGSLVTVLGTGFNGNTFESKGNVVTFTSNLKTYGCLNHPNGITNTTVTCYTEPMVKGDYRVNLVVGDNPVNESAYCVGRDHRCRFQTEEDQTPTVEGLSAVSGPIGLLITMNGQIMSNRYAANDISRNITNSVEEKLLRVYMGSNKCEMLKEDGTLYGMDLDTPTSKTGWLTCRIVSKLVGPMNLTYLLENYGRSKSDINLLRPFPAGPRKDKIAQFEQYAVINSISVTEGSTEGGTDIIITGAGLADRTLHTPRIQVGGVDCVKVIERSDENITCRSPPQDSSSHFFGNRGLVLRSWISTATDTSLDSIPTMSESESTFSSSRLENSTIYLPYTADGRYLGYAEAYMEAPVDGDYIFNLDGDTGCTCTSKFSTTMDPADSITLNNDCNNNSTKVTLVGGQKYFVRIIFSTEGSTTENNLTISLSMSRLNASHNAGQHFGAQNEVQMFNINGDSDDDIQTIDLAGLTSDTGNGVDEVQTLTMTGTGAFRLKLHAEPTVLLSSTSPADDVATAINNLACVPNDSPVTVTKATNVFTVTFSGFLGDWAAFEAVDVEDSLSIAVAESTKGVSEHNSVILQHKGRISPPISLTPSENAMTKAIEKLFSVICPPGIESNMFNDYEDQLKPSWIEHQNGGNFEDVCDPFCGKSVYKNPHKIFYGRSSSYWILMKPSTNKWMCFAYKGVFRDIISIHHRRYYLNADRETKEKSGWMSLSTFNFSKDTSKWHYNCVNVLEAMQNYHNDTANDLFYKVRQILVYKHNMFDGNTYLDAFGIYQTAPDNFADYANIRRVPDTCMRSVSVVKTGTQYVTTLDPWECQAMDVLSVRDPQGSFPDIQRTQTGSPPIGGNLKVISSDGKEYSFPANAEDWEVESALRNKTLGKLGVQRWGNCHGYDYRIEWLTKPGDQPAFTCDGSELTGPNPSCSVTESSSGCAYYPTIPGYMWKTHHSTAQVTAVMNYLPALCNVSSGCDFTWTSSATPTVSAISPLTGTRDTVITVTGTGFDALVLENNELRLSEGTECVVSAATATEFTCTLGEGYSGSYQAVVAVRSKGRAQMSSMTFTYTGAVTSVTPTSTGLGGGNEMILEGAGLKQASGTLTVTIGGQECVTLSANNTEIICKIPQGSAAGQVSLAVTGDSVTSSVTTFTYDDSLTPRIANIAPTTGSPLGGQIVTVGGTGFGSQPTLSVQLRDTTNTSLVFEGSALTWADTLVTVQLPPLQHGTYTFELFVKDKGIAITSSDAIPQVTSVFEVTDYDPKETSAKGGGLFTITGSGFIENESVIKIGDILCDPQSQATTEIVCKLREVTRVHVVENLDAEGNYAWDTPDVTAELTDVVRFMWSTDVSVPPKYKIEQTSGPTATEAMANGFTSGNATTNGTYDYQCLSEGVVYYWSGIVLPERPALRPRGVIRCIAQQGQVAVLGVSINGISAKFSLSAKRRRRSTSTCPSIYIPACTNSMTPSATQPTVVQTPCLTGVMTALTPSMGTADTTITITGTSFGTDTACIEVYIYDKLTNIQSVTDTQVTVKVNPNDTPFIFAPLLVSVVIINKGLTSYTLKSSDRSFTYKPHISSIQPSTGSVAGNTQLTITGAGFNGQVAVAIDGTVCTVIGIPTNTEIICATGARTQQTSNLLVAVNVQGYQAVTCSTASNCQFSYLDSATPQVTSVLPTSVPDPSGSATTTLTITGNNFGTTSSAVKVEIGGETCTVGSVTATSILCSINNLPVGTTRNLIMVELTPGGNNKASDNIRVTGLKEITSITPATGSLEGGTLITLSGNGFYTDTTVTVDGVTCPIASVTLSQVVCTTPAHVAAAVDVIATSLTEVYTAETFTYDSASTPTITAISPTNGYTAGTTVTITGTLFSSTPAENTVTIGGIACVVSTSSGTSIDCALGSKPAGAYPVAVSVLGKGIASDPASGAVTFTYNMDLTSVSPVEGSYGGGQIVTVVGNGLSASASVSVCGATCTVSSSTPPTSTAYICTMPAHTYSTTDTPCDVVATSGTVTDTLTAAFTYKSSLTASITSLSPTRGGTGGGTHITITGTNFGTVMSDVTVMIDNVGCVVSSLSDTQIVCVTGAHPGNVMAPIIVSKLNQGQSLNTGSTSFYYVDVFSSKYTWGGMRTPMEGDLVVVEIGNTLVIDMDTPILKMLLIKGGTVMFDDTVAEIELNVENIMIMDGGLMQIGTEAAPYLSKVTIILHGHLRSPELPIYGAKTLAIRNGTLDVHGSPTLMTWTQLAATAQVDDTSITLLHDPVNWRVGDYIVIASTGGHKDQHQNEKVQITAISGSTLSINPKLKYKHLGTDESYVSPTKTVTIKLRAEVGLLSHNIVFMGSWNKDFLTKIKACPEQFDPGQFASQTCFQGRFGEEVGSDEYGAAIMLHAPTMNSNLVHIHLEYAELTNVGQAFRLGRYPIHFHLNGNMTGSYVKSCSIHKTYNRAVNIHNSHNVWIKNNVVFDVKGGAIFLEDGIERENVLEYNLLVFVKASSSLLNDDITPAAFWITYPDNIVRHNHVAGGTHFGFWYRMLEHPTGPSYDPSECPRNAPLGEFFNNTVHTVGWYGLWIFEFYEPKEVVGSICSRRTPAPARFQALTAWNNFRGAEWVDCGALQFIDFVAANNFMAGLEHYFIALNVPKYTQNGAMIKDSTIIGCLRYNDHPPCTMRGIVFPFANGMLVDGLGIFNFDGATNEGTTCAAFGTVKIICTCSHICSGYKYKFKNIYWDATATKNANFEWENQAVFVDIDGSLTNGASKTSVVADSAIVPSTCVRDTLGTGWSTNIQAAICPPTVKFIRMAFNKPNPETLLFKNAQFTVCDASGTALSSTLSVPWRDKDDSHPAGWKAVLRVNETYCMSWQGMEHVTNLSYSAEFYGVTEYDWLFIKHVNVINAGTVWDKVKILASVDAANTNIVPQTLQISDPEGSVQIQSSASATSATYSVIGRGKGDYGTTKVNFQGIKCLYVNCTVPSNALENTLGARPPNYGKWSEATTWNIQGTVWQGMNENEGSQTSIPPQSSSTQVTIMRGKYVVVDVANIEVDVLIIEGTLEFEYLLINGAYMDHTVKANYIVIRDGFLVAGYQDQIYQGQLSITLTGSLATPGYNMEEGPHIGSKAMAVYGGVELHGIERVPYTTLRATAQQGSSTLLLTEPVDWEVGNEIVISPTGFSPHETETRTITAIGGTSNNEITVNQPLAYTHLGVSETVLGATADIRAEVALITRNINIKGADDDTLDSEAYGCRVIVGREVDTRDTNNIRQNMGSFNVSNVRFTRCGQEGFVDPTDPRYALTFMDLGEVNNSKVVNCSFDHGFSTAIGTFGTKNLLVQRNVLHNNQAPVLLDRGENNTWDANLVVRARWYGVDNGRYELDSTKYPGAIEGNHAKLPLFKNNIVAGADRAGFRVDGEKCHDTTTPAAGRWSNNMVHSAMFGVFMLFDEEDGKIEGSTECCTEISNFIIYKAFSYGIYTQIECSIQIKNVKLYDNMVGVFNVIIHPDAFEHLFDDKYVRMEGGMILGQTSSFDCSRDVLHAEDDRNVKAGIEAAPIVGTKVAHSSPARVYGKIGIMWIMGLSADNMIPDPGKLFHFAKKAPNMYLEKHITGVIVGKFGQTCDNNYDVFISSNPISPDVEHKMTVTSLRVDRSTVDDDSIILFERPNLKYASSDECVDFDCDGKKYLFLVDTDGSLLGSPGTVLPDADFEWDGDTRRGMGDYRLPKVMLTSPTGDKLPISKVYDRRGILGVQDCTWNDMWTAYKCDNTYQYERIIIESMDEDFKDRRLSPVMICYKYMYQNKLTTQCVSMNGPRSVGICGGYACTERMSMFFGIAVMKSSMDVYFTGTTPQNLRIHLRIKQPDWVILRMYMGLQYRYDVFYNKYLIQQKNYDAVNKKYVVAPSTDPTLYHPKSTDPYGTNFFDIDYKMLHILLGPGVVDIKLTPQIIMSTTLTTMTESEFYSSDKVVANLADFLGIPASKISVMNVVAESKRRKRNTGFSVNFMIGNPAKQLHEEDPQAITTNDLIAMANKLIHESQTGSMTDVLGTEVSGVMVAKPAPPVTDAEAWVAYTELQDSLVESGGSNLLPVYKPISMTMNSPKEGECAFEGKPFRDAPIFMVVDDQDRAVPLLVAPDGSDWLVKAFLDTSDPFADNQAYLTGSSVQYVINGYAHFENLGISHAGHNYKINFEVINPSDLGAGYKHSMTVPVVPKRDVHMEVKVSKEVVQENELFDMIIRIKDVGEEGDIHDLMWKGDVWTGRIYPNGMIDQPIELIGNGNITFSNRGYYKVSGLALQGQPGTYAISTIVRTPTADYVLLHTQLIKIIGVTDVIPDTAFSKSVTIKFDDDFAKIGVNKELFLLTMYHLLIKITSEVEFYNMAVYEGSIYVNFTVHGEPNDVEVALLHIAEEMKKDGSIRFGDSEIAYSPYMKVDGHIFKGLDGSRGLSKAVIIALSVVGALLLIVIIVIVIVVCCKKNGQKSNTSSREDLKESPDYGSGFGQKNRIFIHDTPGQVVFDSKQGDYKMADNSRPSSGYSSKPGSANSRGAVTPALGKKSAGTQKPTKVMVGANVSTGGRPVSSLSRPSTGETRAASRSSVLSKQEIVTSFTPRPTNDEGAGPNTITSIQD